MKDLLHKLRLFFYFKNPLYNLIIEKRLSAKILYSPEEVWIGDSEIGLKIINGYVNFYGESFNFQRNLWEKNRASEFWNDKLNSFDWIKDVRAVGTNKARIFLRNNILEWLKKNSNGFNLDIKDISNETGLLALQGPKSRALLEQILEGIKR